MEPGNLEKNKKLFAPIEEFLLKQLSKGGKIFPKFEITDTLLSITTLINAKKR